MRAALSLAAAGALCASPAAAAVPAAGASAAAQRLDKPMKEVEGVGIEEKLEARVPAGLRFRDHRGEELRFGELFDGERPVVLTFNYEACPKLCSVQLGGFVKSLQEIEGWTVGDDFRVATVGMDPTETDERAAAFRERILGDYGREEAREGWKFLRGEEEAVRALADAVGYSYRFLPERGQYSHTAAVMLLTPGGRVARYLYGIEFNPTTLRLSLAETADGKFVSAVESVLLYCFSYDPDQGSYTAIAWNITRIVLGIFALCLIGFLSWLWWHGWRSQNQPKAA